MAWLRKIGLEFVNIIVKSDFSAAVTSLIQSCSNEESFEDDHREVSSGQLEKMGSSREPSSRCKS